MATIRDVIRFELIMDAGNGAQKAGDILIKAFAKSGRYVFIEPLIPAEISPPKRTPHSMSGAVIRLANFEITNIGSSSDIMLFEHEILLERRLNDKDYSEGGLVLLDMAESKRSSDAYEAAIKRAEGAGLTVVKFDMDDDSIQTIKELNGNGKNMFYLGMLSSVFSIDKDEMKTFIRQTFKKLSEEKLNKNLTIFENGFNNATSIVPEKVDVPVQNVSSDEKVLLDGNTALSLGIIDSGIRFFSGYPITPASTIMHTLSRMFPSYGGMVHQAEDEISAIGAMLGGYYSGVPSITATSGPGLSLKQEFIGLSYASEIPGIIVDVQRGGPSTGLPTRTEQTDLFAAAFGAHGDSAKVVISVANVEDCMYVPHLARYFAEVLKMPIVILSDYITSVSYRVLNKLPLYELENAMDIDSAILDRFYIDKLPENVPMVKDNQSEPGQDDRMRRVTGLNTDVTGNVVYTSDSNQRSHDIRNNKLHLVRKALKKPEIIGEESGDLLIVGWGSSRGVMEEAVKLAQKEGVKVSALHLKIVYPLPLSLKDIFKNFKRVVTMEVAYADELKPSEFSMLLRSETLTDVGMGISQATGRPLKPRSVLARIKELV